MDLLEQMREDLLLYGSGPTLAEMPRCSLAYKLLNGPTAAHRIEEIHTPFNFAYITCTTGSSAIQNLVGVTQQELPMRAEAGKRALEKAGLKEGDSLLITYPPLISVFSRKALDEYGLKVSFILRPSRDALLVSLVTEQPRAVLGESSFLRSALVDAKRMGLSSQLSENLIFIAAGSPLDPELEEEAARIPGARVHDLYGCQEFGWLCLDGFALRDDISLFDYGRSDGRVALLAGGLPTGDCFLTKPTAEDSENGLPRILTPTRQRLAAEPEVTVLAGTAADAGTLQRTARSILRIKAKIVRVPENVQCRAEATELLVSIPGTACRKHLRGPKATRLFDDLLEAQKAYQREAKTDPVWNKPC